jgi:hypothetical protein
MAMDALSIVGDGTVGPWTWPGGKWRVRFEGTFGSGSVAVTEKAVSGTTAYAVLDQSGVALTITAQRAVTLEFPAGTLVSFTTTGSTNPSVAVTAAPVQDYVRPA